MPWEVGANIQRLFVQRTGMFRSEPFLLIGDVIRRETQTYESVLKAVASGLHTPAEIAKALEVSSSYLSSYLRQLESLHLLEHVVLANELLIGSMDRRKNRREAPAHRSGNAISRFLPARQWRSTS